MTERRVEATAPVRICDVGGWTDTWFAGHGRVCSIAVGPGVRVRADARLRRAGAAPGTMVHALDLPDAGHHPLIDAAVAEAAVPDDLAVEAWISSNVPPGAGTGTSAAVVVALLAALAAAAGSTVDAGAVAASAHRVETERLGLQSGVQDQLAAAHGGICWIEVGPFPTARVEQVAVDDTTRRELDRRLLVVFLGRGHASSSIHDAVIAALAPGAPPLEALRQAAGAARSALEAGDFEAYGEALAANTAAQHDLHPSLVSDDARRVGRAAVAAGASGWKVNGAGGEGGSVSVLCGASPGSRPAVTAAVTELDRSFRVLPVQLSRGGVRVSQRR